nr:IS3 family transposase [Chromobacterium haemolyticum]
MVTRIVASRRQTLDRNAELRQRLCELVQERRRFGSLRLHVMLQREGWQVNHKRVEQVYREAGLSLRFAGGRNGRVFTCGSAASERAEPALVDGLRRRHPMEWQADSDPDSVDTWSREAVWIEVDHSLSGKRVASVLERLWDQGRCPELIQVDNGPEFTSKVLDEWDARSAAAVHPAREAGG